jgi:hypothetical protein
MPQQFLHSQDVVASIEQETRRFSLRKHNGPLDVYASTGPWVVVVPEIPDMVSPLLLP